MALRDDLGGKFRIDVVVAYPVSWLLLQAVAILAFSYFAAVYHHFRALGLAYAGLSAVLLGFVAYASARHGEKVFYGFISVALTVLLAWLLLLLSRYLYRNVEAWRDLMQGDFLVHFNRAARIGMKVRWIWAMAAGLTVLGAFGGTRAARPRRID
jgi:hypothetical protein